MNFNQDNVNQTYVLKSITSPSDWWLKYGNQQAGIWHEVYRLCDLKLLAESFCSIAKFRNTRIYSMFINAFILLYTYYHTCHQDFLVLPSYIITAADGQGNAWISQPYTSGQVLPVIDTVNLRHETLQALSHYICQRQDKTCLHTEFQGDELCINLSLNAVPDIIHKGYDTVQDGLCIFDCRTYTSDQGMPINHHISIFIANHICNAVCHGLDLTPFTS
jgi:Alpha-kinase family